MTPAAGRAAASLLVAGAMACAGEARRPLPAAPEPHPAPAARLSAGSKGPAEPAPAEPEPEPPLDPLVLVTDPPTLSALEASGLGFASVIDGSPAASLEELASRAAFGSIEEVLRADVAGVARKDPLAGVGILAHAHRLFDVRWLRSPKTRFELVAVVGRLDRRPFHDEACGETRLVYRLGYEEVVRGEAVASRLPMTINVEILGDDSDAEGGCAGAAALWRVPPDLRGAALAEWLMSRDGPLHAERIARSRFSQVVVNLQTVRWPSTVRPAMGGHAEYLLRAFAWQQDAQRYVPHGLENTPDVARLRADRRLFDALVSWVRDPENLRRIDEGVHRLPDAFLATEAVSVTPRGLARRANRPYRQLLDPAAFADLDLSGTTRIRSPEALVRRLDDATCQGCHQSRSLAGFHLLGEDPDAAPPGTALVTGSSPHLRGELGRRLRVLERLSDGAAPDYARPFAERADEDSGGYGAACGLGDSGFSSWTCAAGLECTPVDVAAGEAAAVGACLPAAPGVGDPCELGPVRPHADPHRDRVVGVQRRACSDAMVCNKSAVGFPGGMCTGRCEGEEPDLRCGPMALLAPFNACLARGEPFPRCLEHVRPVGLRACDRDHPCRNDYLCARSEGDAGVCIPPYFLMQLRVDGH